MRALAMALWALATLMFAAWIGYVTVQDWRRIRRTRGEPRR